MSAQDIVEDPGLAIDDITSGIFSRSRKQSDELSHFSLEPGDIEDLAVLKIFGQGTGRHKWGLSDISPSILDASFEDAIDQTPSFTLVVHDPDWELLNTGTLDHTIDINPGKIPHRWYRLNSIEIADDDITLEFLTRNAMYLSYHTKPYKVSRNKMTRAEFILTMLHHVKKKGVNIKMFCPELHKKQPIAKTKPASTKSKNERRGSGIDSGAKLNVNNGVSSTSATSDQIKIGEEILDEGSRQGASPRALTGGMMVAMVESNLKNSATNGQFVGVFQQSSQYGWPASRDATKDSAAFWKKYIPLVRAHPDQDLAKLAQQVQGAFGPGNETYFMKLDKARPDAEKWVEAYTGGAGADNVSWTKSYEFMIGPEDGPRGENYLEALYRLADEVNWSAYWVRDVLHFISQEDLFKSKARIRLRYHTIGPTKNSNTVVVEHVNGTWNRGSKVQTFDVQVRMESWFAPVGTVVIFDEGGPLQGRWLVTHIRRSVFDQLGTVTLSAPINEKKEPAHQMNTRPKDGGDSTPSTPGDVEGTPEQIINDVVIPIALAISDKFQAGGGTGQLSADHVKTANAQHGSTKGGNRSDHQGPGWYAWAADMSDNWGSGSGSPNMDELAKTLGEQFGIKPVTGGNSCHEHSTSRYRFQICYMMNTAQAGNHFNHVHFGIRDLAANPNHPPSAAQTGQRHGGPAT